MHSQENHAPILQVENLSLGFEDASGIIAITEGVSFEMQAGEIYGLVGESGCGKTVTALSLLKLLPIPGGKVLSGRILYKGQDILTHSMADMRKLRGAEIAMIFQEPGAALNPLYTVQQQLLECFQYHPFDGNPKQRVLELLDRVGIADPKRILTVYPHELSGGMLQRVMIAMALLLNPGFIIADEPTTALDVTVQAQIMDLLTGLSREFNTAILMITHNLNLIAQYADRVAVMYAGRMVEEGSVEAVLQYPLHPYTQGLLKALPTLRGTKTKPQPIAGQVPRPKEYKQGCRFYDRCSRAIEICKTQPPLQNVSGLAKGAEVNHRVACFVPGPKP
jgi:peptide/nickel transport system ATP-binding protein